MIAQPRTQHDSHHDTKVKPEAATAVIELLMLGGKTSETCWAVNNRQDNKLKNWLVIYLNWNERCALFQNSQYLNPFSFTKRPLCTAWYTSYMWYTDPSLMLTYFHKLVWAPVSIKKFNFYCTPLSTCNVTLFNAAVAGPVQPTITAEVQRGCFRELSVRFPN